MNIPTEAYPLTWPVAWPRHQGMRERASFSRKVAVSGVSWKRSESLTVATAINRLICEASAFTRSGRTYRIDPEHMVISTNIPATRAGMPMSGRSEPVDPGVAVYFHFDGKPMVLACDKWDRVADNIAAIAAHLDAMRGMERWGVGKLSQVFAGYAALPAPGQTFGTWYDYLGVPHNATFEQAREAYREKAKKAHPDNGGSHEEMTRLNAYWDQARQQFQR
jgi:hypothetical protein